jgi:hypothetical protein
MVIPWSKSTWIAKSLKTPGYENELCMYQLVYPVNV